MSARTTTVINTSSLPKTTTSENTNGTTSASTKTDGLDISPAVTLAILLATSFLLVLGTLAYFYFRKRRCISCDVCLQRFPTRKRTSSTSSQGPLTQDDTTIVSPSGPRQERELFSISDQDGGEDGRQTQRGRRNTDDDYFYDEIFERSAFVDESINRANKHLTMERDDDDEIELGDTNVPDLVFKKQY